MGRKVSMSAQKKTTWTSISQNVLINWSDTLLPADFMKLFSAHYTVHATVSLSFIQTTQLIQEIKQLIKKKTNYSIRQKLV